MSILSENIIYYRKQIGLSQEKLSEYIGVSRQAVTKWENGISKPSTKNLIQLAKLFNVDVNTLLNNKNHEKPSARKNVSTEKSSWIFIAISIVCIITYLIYSIFFHAFSAGVLICMFVLIFLMQTFLHIYFSQAIKYESFSGIAGFDGRIEYNISELKKMLTQIDLHVNVISALYVFLLCVFNCININIDWMNELLIIFYLLDCITAIILNNYKMIDKIYIKDDDKKLVKQSLPNTIVYIFMLFVGTIITVIIFKVKIIKNNTIPALKIGGLLILSIVVLTIGYILENNHVKKNLVNIKKTNKLSLACLFICLIIYGIMCII